LLFVPEMNPSRGRPPRRGTRNEPAKARLMAAIKAIGEAQLEAARALVEIDESGHVVFEGCASLGEFGERLGLSAAETRRLHALGRAMEAVPEIEGKVRAGAITVASAAVIGSVVLQPKLLRSTDRWVEWAERESTRELVERYERRREEVVLGDAEVVPLRFFVSAATRDGFDRARRIASRKEGVVLTPGQTFQRAVDHYLGSFDLLAKPARKRRLADTRGLPGRPMAAEVRRELMSRGADRCSVPYCDHRTFLENAHGVAKAAGGDQESANTSRDCAAHHTMVDAGQMTMRGTPQAPEYETQDGRSLSSRFGSGEAGATANASGEGPAGPGPPTR
jgi:hypothetical protein